MKCKKHGKSGLGDNPSLIQCLLEDASTNLTNKLGDVLGYVLDCVETCEKVHSHLKKQHRRLWEEGMDR